MQRMARVTLNRWVKLGLFQEKDDEVKVTMRPQKKLMREIFSIRVCVVCSKHQEQDRFIDGQLKTCAPARSDAARCAGIADQQPKALRVRRIRKTRQEARSRRGTP